MASLHGRELLDQGFTLEQVVREYGDVCQAVTNLAADTKAPIEVSEFRTFNRCLDNAIAAAVTAYVQRRGTLDEVRVNTGAKARLRPLNLATFLGHVIVSAAPHAIARGCHFAATVPDKDLLVNADAELLSSAVVNLLDSAFKFSKSDSDVRLRAQRVSDRILIEVENDFGGMQDRSELGLDLQNCRRRVELNNGILSARNIQGGGYVFTIELPLFTDRPDRMGQPELTVTL